MPTDVERLIQAILEFNERIDAAAGLYFDATQGFAADIERLDRAQQMLQGSGIDDFDSLSYVYGQGDPREPGAQILHTTTQGEFRQRNIKDGPNSQLIGQFVLVFLYSSWEERFRSRIAEAIGIEELQVPILGDLRLLRNAILHNKGRGTRETERRLQVLAPITEGAPIAADTDTVVNVVVQIKSSLDEMAEEHAGNRLDLGRIRFMSGS